MSYMEVRLYVSGEYDSESLYFTTDTLEGEKNIVTILLESKYGTGESIGCYNIDDLIKALTVIKESQIHG